MNCVSVVRMMTIREYRPSAVWYGALSLLQQLGSGMIIAFLRKEESVQLVSHLFDNDRCFVLSFCSRISPHSCWLIGQIAILVLYVLCALALIFVKPYVSSHTQKVYMVTYHSPIFRFGMRLIHEIDF
jgi:hypothetical protein